MSKVAFFNIPAHGHINPTLPVVKELISRGEEVVYYSVEEFKDKIQKTGGEFRHYPTTYKFDYTRPPTNLISLGVILLETAQAYIPAILKTMEGEKFEYIIHDAMCPWGRMIAEILNIPAICSVSTFAFHRSMLFSSGSFVHLVDMFLLNKHGYKKFHQLAKQLQTEYSLAKFGIFDALTNYSDLNLVYTSRDFQPSQGLFGDDFRFVGPSIHSPAKSSAIDDKTAVHSTIYISLGTILNERLDFYKLCKEVFRNTRNPVIMSVGTKVNIADLGIIPENIMVRNHVPQIEVLQRAKMFITHGGMNSVQEGLYHGVPLLIYPQTIEQKFVARCVEKIGAGRILTEREFDPSRLQQVSQEIMNDERYAVTARSVGESFKASGGYKRAVEEIMSFKTQSRYIKKISGTPGRFK